MDQQEKSKTNYKLPSYMLLGALIAIGLAVLGHQIGHNFLEAKKLDRTVTVKGLAEKNVKADLAIWPISVKGTGNDLQVINAKIEQDREKILQYLLKQGFDKDEMEVGKYNVTDLLSREYRNKDDENNRYIVSATIDLNTSKVDLVKKTYQQITELIRDGVVVEISDNYGYKGPRYEFTKLNDIKLEMLAEANKNSKKAAEQFAKDSGSKVGSIKRGNQGTFLIEPLYASEVSGSEADTRSSINKKVRVVTTTDYYLID